MTRPLPTDSAPRNRLPALVWLLALSPALAAIWLRPGFVTQDGPAHLYNAQILADSLRGGPSMLRDAFEVRWLPLPNWAGHLAEMAMALALPAHVADRLMMTLTLLAPSVASAWLRRRVVGSWGGVAGALWSALLGMNVAWLWGFDSFLIGAALFALTLGAWWTRRDRFGPRQAAALAALLAAGYFAHLVSLGLTMFGLVVLAATTPGPDRGRRLAWTLASLAAPAPLVIYYKGLMRSGGSIRPAWGLLDGPLSAESFAAQLGWVDPLTLGSKTVAPFVEPHARAFGVLVPYLWAWLAVAVAAAAMVAGRPRGDRPYRARRGWAILAGLLILGGLLGPDRLGDNHGDYLPQRVLLLGLIALGPALDFGATAWGRRLASAALAVAVGLQSAFVWDYALRSDRLVSEFLGARPAVGRGQRVGTLLFDWRPRYRANPLMHADCLLGADTGNVIWANYEAAHYYFPVRFRGDVPHPPELEFERISKLDEPADAPERARRWRDLLERHQRRIDRLVVWNADPTLDAITARWFEPILQSGRARVFRRRP